MRFDFAQSFLKHVVKSILLFQAVSFCNYVHC